jgi:hypothetical protein
MYDEYWTKRDGTQILVGHMEEGHLRNTLRLLERKGLLKNASHLPEEAARQSLREYIQFQREAALDDELGELAMSGMDYYGSLE